MLLETRNCNTLDCSVNVMITLNGNLSNITNIEEYKNELIQDIGGALSINPNRIIINDLQSGSIIVSLTIEPSTNSNNLTPIQILNELEQQINNPTNLLNTQRNDILSIVIDCIVSNFGNFNSC